MLAWLTMDARRARLFKLFIQLSDNGHVTFDLDWALELMTNIAHLFQSWRKIFRACIISSCILSDNPIVETN